MEDTIGGLQSKVVLLQFYCIIIIPLYLKSVLLCDLKDKTDCTHPLIEVCVMKNPRNDFAIVCQI